MDFDSAINYHYYYGKAVGSKSALYSFEPLMQLVRV